MTPKKTALAALLVLLLALAIAASASAQVQPPPSDDAVRAIAQSAQPTPPSDDAVRAIAQSAQPTPPSDDAVNAVAKQLYCPVCENIPLDVCPTQACAEWRELIRLKLSEGWNEDQIRTYFAEQYGDRVLATPRMRGLYWLLPLLPWLCLLAGVVIVIIAFIAWRKSASGPKEAAGAQTNEADQAKYAERLEDELKKY